MGGGRSGPRDSRAQSQEGFSLEMVIPKKGAAHPVPPAIVSPRQAPIVGQALGCVRLGEQQLLSIKVLPLLETKAPWTPSFSWTL